jgi:predicted membrane GTPase involved in stress response
MVLGIKEIDTASGGEIVMVAGTDEITIGDTITSS